MQNRVQGRGNGRSRQPPCPHPLPENSGHRRHAHCVEARPAWPQFARPHHHALDGFKKQSIKFQSLTEAIDTETPTGRAMWQMIGVLAELEHSLITERTRAGVKDAKRRGVKFGPHPMLITAGSTCPVRHYRGPAATAHTDVPLGA
jgi:hypothetical protein